jgi:hypothetical protein
VLLVLLAGSSLAEAQERRVLRGGNAPKIQGVRFDVHLDLGWDDFGVGFRVDIPVVPDGFLRSSRVEDEFVISPGLDVMFFDWDDDHYDRCNDDFDDDDIGIWPVVVAQWNIYLNDKWSVFPELGIAFMFLDSWDDDWEFRRGGWVCDDDDFDVTAAVSFGARYHFTRRLSLLMRVNWPAGLQIGLTF